MSIWTFARQTIFNPRSPACAWRHPAQAVRLAAGAVQNNLLNVGEKVTRSGRHDCPVCGWSGLRFRTFLSADEVIPDSICPRCLSFDRHRLLVLGLRRELEGNHAAKPEVMLGFSLSTALRLLLEREGLPRCWRSDVARGDDRFAPDFICDLRACAMADATVDWLFCSHVLEHVPDLDRCLAEIARLLRPGGIAWIQVPLEPDLDCSRPIEIDPERAHAHAWQFGRDFMQLLDRQDWGIREIAADRMLSSAELVRHGIDPRERFWQVRKA